MKHYKYTEYVDGYEEPFEQEYSFKYEFDDRNRITKTVYDGNNYIELKYDEDKISEIKGKDYKYEFKYSDNEIKIKKTIEEELLKLDDGTVSTNNTETNEKIIQETICTIKSVDYEGAEYVLYQEKNKEDDKVVLEILCKKNNQDISYSNLVSILNVTYPNYVNINTNFSNDFFYNKVIPIFNAGAVMYMKTDTNTNFYYNKDGKILLFENEYGGKSNYKYYDDNQGYMLSQSENYNKKYYYTEFEDVVNSEGIITKRTEKVQEISREEYEEKVLEYEKYIEENKVEMPKVDI